MDLQEKTQQLTKLFDELRTIFGAGKMAGWSLNVSSTPPLHSVREYLTVANCDKPSKTVWIDSEFVDRYDLERSQETLIHEFAHLYTEINFQGKYWGHSFAFHLICSLLLAKYHLPFDTSTYNLKDDYLKRLTYDPALLYRFCRFVAPRLSNASSLDHYFTMYISRVYVRKANRVNLIRRERHYLLIEQSVYDLQTQNLGLRRIAGLSILAGVMLWMPTIIEWSVKHIGS